MNQVPHQLLVHLDQHPEGRIEIRYCYPFSRPHELQEEMIVVAAHNVPVLVRDSLEYLRGRLRARHKVEPIRFPHREILPNVQDGILTVVTRDERRSLPLARLYLYETINNVSKVEIETRMESGDFGADDHEAWQKIRQWANGRAWNDYEFKMNMDSN
jgi:hypothetical protein